MKLRHQFGCGKYAIFAKIPAPTIHLARSREVFLQTKKEIFVRIFGKNVVILFTQKSRHKANFLGKANCGIPKKQTNSSILVYIYRGVAVEFAKGLYFLGFLAYLRSIRQYIDPLSYRPTYIFVETLSYK